MTAPGPGHGRGRDLHDAVVAITGAGSGIGRALADHLAAQGARLALADVSSPGLQAAAEALRARGTEVTTAVLDVADRPAVWGWAERVVADHGRINVIVNNAGIGVGAYVDELDPADWDRVLAVNLGGVVNGTLAFLPHLRQAMWGHVVNLSSMLGVLAVPSMATYVTSKAAVRAFTETLAMELRADRSTVHATVVLPGGVRTNLYATAKVTSPRLERLGVDPSRLGEQLAATQRTSPEVAAAAIVDGIRRRRLRVVIGADARASLLAQRLAPVGVQRAAAVGDRLVRHGVARRRR